METMYMYRIPVSELAVIGIMIAVAVALMWRDLQSFFENAKRGVLDLPSLAVIAAAVAFLAYTGYSIAHARGIDFSEISSLGVALASIFSRKKEEKKEPPKPKEVPIAPAMQPQPQTSQGAQQVQQVQQPQPQPQSRGELDEIKKMITNLAQEIKEVRQNTEQSLIDIRALLSEISNPLNYMRRFASESEMREMGIDVERLQQPQQPQIQQAQQAIAPAQAPPTQQPTPQMPSQPPQPALTPSGMPSGDALANLMWIMIELGDMITSLGSESVKSNIDVMIAHGLLPKEISQYVDNAIKLIKEAGSPREAAKRIYRTAKLMKIESKEAEKLYYRILEEEEKERQKK
jgi:signal transduction histidine kinase